MANINSVQENVQTIHQQAPSFSRVNDSEKFRVISLIDTISQNAFNFLFRKILTTNTFALSTRQFASHENGFLIKIEFVNPRQSKTDILLFSAERSPCRTDLSFTGIQALVSMIFHPSKTFHGWNLNRQHLNAFVRIGYLTQSKLDQITIIDLQDRFKQWYNQTFPHLHNCPAISSFSSSEIQVDDPSCSCQHRPYKQTNDKWNLSHAFQRVFRLRFHKLNRNDFSNAHCYEYHMVTLYHDIYKTMMLLVVFKWNLRSIALYREYIIREHRYL